MLLDGWMDGGNSVCYQVAWKILKTQKGAQITNRTYTQTHTLTMPAYRKNIIDTSQLAIKVK